MRKLVAGLHDRSVLPSEYGWWSRAGHQAGSHPCQDGRIHHIVKTHNQQYTFPKLTLQSKEIKVGRLGLEGWVQYTKSPDAVRGR